MVVVDVVLVLGSVVACVVVLVVVGKPVVLLLLLLLLGRTTGVVGVDAVESTVVGSGIHSLANGPKQVAQSG